MAYTTQVTDNGIVHNVIHFSSKAQQIDDAVANMGGASTPQAALAALGAGVRSNGVLNPYALVNQAGQSSYSNHTGGTAYAFDGRKGRLYDVSLADGVETISIAGVSTGAARYGAVVPQGVQAGKTYTASVLVKAKSVTGNPYFMCSNNLTNIGTVAYIPQPSQNYVILSTTFTAASEGSSVLLELVAPNGSSLTADVRGWKTEEGLNQTLAYQDINGILQLLPQPDSSYAAQLLECQRYQVPIATGLSVRASLVTTNYITFLVPLPCTLRTTPSISGSGLVVRNINGSIQSDFSFTVDFSGPGWVRIIATKTSHGLSDAELTTTGAVMLVSNL